MCSDYADSHTHAHMVDAKNANSKTNKYYNNK